MGVELTNPDSRPVPIASRSGSPTSARWRWPRPTPRSPTAACTATPIRHRDPRRDGKVVQTTPQCNRVMQQPTRRRGQRHPQGRHGSWRFRRGAGTSTDAAGKTGTIHGNKAVWFVGYTPTPRHRVDDRRRQLQGQPIGSNGQTVGGAYIDVGVRLRPGRPDVGARDAGRSRSGCPTSRSPRRSRHDRGRSRFEIPDVTVMSDAASAAAPGRMPGIHVSIGDRRPSDERRGHGAPTTSPRRR